MTTVISCVAWLLVVASATALVVGRFGARCDACDVLNIAFSYWLVAAVTGLLVLWITYARRGAGLHPLAVASILIIVVAIRAPMPVATGCESGVNSARLKIVSFNAWMNNPRPTIAMQWIMQQRPDVVVLVEAKGGAGQLPALLARDFPYQVACLTKMPCSTRILSRLPPTMRMSLGQGDVENRKGLSAAALSLTMLRGQAVTIVGIHLSRPLPLGQQRRELSTLRDRLRGIDPSSLIIAGDLNAPPDSMTLRDFAQAHQLGRVPTGATWPTPVAYPHIPSLLAIDHIFLGRNIGLLESGIGPTIGSDHRPTFATLCLIGPEHPA